MGQRFLMDTNVVIGYLSNQLPSSTASAIDNLPEIIPVITRIELLGWYNAKSIQPAKIQHFIDNSQIYNLNEEVISQTILLRQRYKIKLPDAVIAATAMIHNYTLISRNVDDFENIINLDFENSWLW